MGGGSSKRTVEDNKLGGLLLAARLFESFVHNRVCTQSADRREAVTPVELCTRRYVRYIASCTSWKLRLSSRLFADKVSLPILKYSSSQSRSNRAFVGTCNFAHWIVSRLLLPTYCEDIAFQRCMAVWYYQVVVGRSRSGNRSRRLTHPTTIMWQQLLAVVCCY